MNSEQLKLVLFERANVLTSLVDTAIEAVKKNWVTRDEVMRDLQNENEGVKKLRADYMKALMEELSTIKKQSRVL
ncbi:hypothetical protein [Chitinophaga sp. CF418]|uniref:hypothetical protein n=1 Tax=Chitinophaga sp. CF418 TaxID=1855287 RepID=UPI0009215DAA|nr:hypothetical protein [Chitinophaga sp. CF418]SHN45867.1 hypothetical protein SAMN05216311_1224 [Chitinophaga sp. CF418]